MVAVLRSGKDYISPLPIKLGQQGPFPDAPMQYALERRWLHYAFLSRDNQWGMVANFSYLGPDEFDEDDESQRCTSILLVYKREVGWEATQFNAETLVPLWSAFARPHAYATPHPYRVMSTAGSPGVDFTLQRSSHPCTSQCAPFDRWQYLRWQSETGVIARGRWHYGGKIYADVEAIGYHERVRGYWGWPELGGWVFGFANDPHVVAKDAPPPAALVFTLIQPLAPENSATASVMVWLNGRLRCHFPRRNLDVAIRGEMDRDQVCCVPELSNMFGVAPMEPVPRRLMITGHLGDNHVVLDFEAVSAARIIIPNENGIDPFSVHEVIGRCRIEGQVGKESFAFETYGIVEFAGGAGGD